MVEGARRRRPGDGGLRARLATGSLGIFVVVVAGIVALFALYYADLQHQRATEALRTLERAHATAGQAQVAFKLQVQEWKNVLLRGRDPADYLRYREAMEARAGEVRAALSALAQSDMTAPGPDGRDLPERVGEILSAHEAMMARYTEALAAFEATEGRDPWSADARVRGIDRPIDEALDRLAEHFVARADANFAENRALAEERYQDLRRVVLAAHGLGVLLLLALLLASLRGAAARR